MTAPNGGLAAPPTKRDVYKTTNQTMGPRGKPQALFALWSGDAQTVGSIRLEPTSYSDIQNKNQVYQTHTYIKKAFILRNFCFFVCILEYVNSIVHMNIIVRMD